MMKKKAMAYWSVVCPGCNMGRKYGKKVVLHVKPIWRSSERRKKRNKKIVRK
jgi:hypothetical protein